MARNPSEDIVYMQVTLPKELPLTRNLKVSYELHPGSFRITWLEFFNNHDRDIFNFLQSNPGKFSIQGRRNKVAGFALDQFIGAFINSFKRILSTYRARIVHSPSRTRARRTATVAPPTPNHGQQLRATLTRRASQLRTPVAAGNEGNNSGRGNQAGSAAGPVPANTMPGTIRNDLFLPRTELPAIIRSAVATQQNNSATSAAQAGLTLGSQFYRDVDVNSNPRAPSTEADSSVASEDLGALQNGNLKKNIIEKILLHTDRIGLLKMKQELQAKIDDGKWARFSRQQPYTAAILVPILELSFAPASTRK